VGVVLLAERLKLRGALKLRGGNSARSDGRKEIERGATLRRRRRRRRPNLCMGPFVRDRKSERRPPKATAPQAATTTMMTLLLLRVVAVVAVLKVSAMEATVEVVTQLELNLVLRRVTRTRATSAL
jgi:hypothetical protein